MAGQLDDDEYVRRIRRLIEEAQRRIRGEEETAVAAEYEHVRGAEVEQELSRAEASIGRPFTLEVMRQGVEGCIDLLRELHEMTLADQVAAAWDGRIQSVNHLKESADRLDRAVADATDSPDLWNDLDTAREMANDANEQFERVSAAVETRLDREKGEE
jgi:hypothetical protein